MCSTCRQKGSVCVGTIENRIDVSIRFSMGPTLIQTLPPGCLYQSYVVYAGPALETCALTKSLPMKNDALHFP